MKNQNETVELFMKNFGFQVICTAAYNLVVNDEHKPVADRNIEIFHTNQVFVEDLSNDVSYHIETDNEISLFHELIDELEALEGDLDAFREVLGEMEGE